jgi:hypothetical protein
MRDAYQERMIRANHEAAHALAFYLYGRAIQEIDIDWPDRSCAGWVVPAPAEPISMPPEGVDVFGWVDAHLERFSRETAVCARVGSLAAGDNWYGPTCARDRAIVLAACPSWLAPSAWEEFVLWHAEEMLEGSRFRTAHKPLSDALLERPHDKMSGARAVEIIETALREEVRGPGGGGPPRLEDPLRWRTTAR